MQFIDRAIVLALALGLAPSLCSAKATARAHPAPSRKASRSAGARSAARPRKAPPLSFLAENSYSVRDLIAQVQANPKLRLRYANHFHIRPDEVVPYFRQNLVESYIPTTQRYKVWMKRPDGSTYYAYQTFRAGTRVLALKNGQPVLKWACGNPLLTRLPPVQKRVVQRTKKVLPQVQRRTRYVELETPFETPRRLAALPPPALPPAVSPLYEAPPSQMEQFLTRQPVSAPVGRYLPAIGLIGLFPRHGGHAESIPEPPTALLAVVGLLGAGLVARTRHATRRA